MLSSKSSKDDTSEHYKCWQIIVIAALGVMLLFQVLALGLGFEIGFHKVSTSVYGSWLYVEDTSAISTSASYHANVRYSDPCPDCCDNNNQDWGDPSYLFASARTDFAHDCGIGATRFFLYFAEINEIPANVTVQAAIIKLFGVREGESWMGFRDDSPNDMEIKRVTSPWYAHRTSWNNQPNSTDINSVIIPGTTLRGEYNPAIDVTALVRDMRSAGQKNYGFVFKMQVEVPYRSCAFYSLQYKDVTRRPKLELQLVSENL